MLQPSDIKFFLSGGQFNTDPDKSLGGDYSDTTIGNDINNIFDDVTTALSRQGYIDYKCIYLFNRGSSQYDWIFDSSLWTDLQKNSPIQIDLGITLNDDVQQLTVSGNVTGGYIRFEYTDIAGMEFTTTNINWMGSVTNFAQQIQTQINYLKPLVGGVSCSATSGSGFTNYTITFGGDDGNKIHNILKVSNFLTGTDIVLQMSKVSDGSPINTVATSIALTTEPPEGIVFQSTNNNNKKVIGTLQQDEGFPIWVRRTIIAGTNPSSNAGATIKFNGKVFPVDPTPKASLEPTPTPTPTATPEFTPFASSPPTPSPTPTPTSTFAYANLWSWGQNIFGQLGQDSTTDLSEPTQFVAGSSEWLTIGKFYRTTYVTRTDNKLWGWGANLAGCLGNNTKDNEKSPIQIMTDKSIQSISNGIDFTLFLTTGGELYAAGSNIYGQLGDGTKDSKSSPVIISGNTWKSVDAGSYFAAGIDNNNRLWVWGNGGTGNLGRLSTENFSSPVQTSFATTDWKAVSCGYNFICAIKTNGTMWSWGSNAFGQLGRNAFGGSASSPMQIGFQNYWKLVSCGNGHVMAVTNDKKLLVWGNNNYGQLGLADSINRNSPTQVSYAGQQIGSFVEQISAGGWNSAYVSTANDLYVAGKNSNGQLGNRTSTNSTIFFDVSRNLDITTKWEFVSVGYNYMVAREN